MFKETRITIESIKKNADKLNLIKDTLKVYFWERTGRGRLVSGTCFAYFLVDLSPNFLNQAK